MRYVYKINNYPGAAEPVYATLLVYKNQIIGGDVTDTSAKGVVRGFAMRQDRCRKSPAPQRAHYKRRLNDRLAEQHLSLWESHECGNINDQLSFFILSQKRFLTTAPRHDIV